MKFLSYFILGSLLIISVLRAQDQVLNIWPDGVPGAVENPEYTEGLATDKPNRILRVSQPTLSVYLPVIQQNTGAAVLICPGGGYRRLAVDIEGDEIAAWLNDMGIAGFVLKYRLPCDAIMVDKTVGPLQDAQEAMRIIRRHAATWKIDPHKTGVIGFSAGGHLASTLSTHFSDSVYTPSDREPARPDFAILVYPVISMEPAITHTGSRDRLIGENPSDNLVRRFSNELQVTGTTPPGFIIHAADDKSVSPENSIRYFEALLRNGVQAELHIFQSGGHGFGLATSGGTESQWPDICRMWLKSIGIL
jgi:acetyl esterase/lipase